MPRYLEDDPYHTISVSIDSALLARLNTAARLLPESGSRSQLVRDLLNLSLDILLDPVETLPTVVAAIKAQYAVDGLHDAGTA